jgi:hypothetical protein
MRNGSTRGGGEGEGGVGGGRGRRAQVRWQGTAYALKGPFERGLLGGFAQMALPSSDLLCFRERVRNLFSDLCPRSRQDSARKIRVQEREKGVGSSKERGQSLACRLLAAF